MLDASARDDLRRQPSKMKPPDRLSSQNDDREPDGKMSGHGLPQHDLNADRLFAGFIGLAVLLLMARFIILSNTPNIVVFLPLLVYQDALALIIVAWFFHELFSISSSPRARLAVAFAGWTVCLLLAIFTVINMTVYNFILGPLTYRLIAISGYGRGIEATIAQALGPGLRAIAAALMLMLAVAGAFWRLAPAFVQRMRRVFYAPTALFVVVLYLIGARTWAVRNLPYPPAASNAEWAFLVSLFHAPKPVVSAAIPGKYFDDFVPVARTSAPTGAIQDVRQGFFASGSRTAPTGQLQRPLNIIMVVMESVGEHSLQLYGAPYQNTPEMVRLSHHAITFDRIYVAQPNTSSAMAAMFCSLYPDHDWRSITGNTPTLKAPALPAILAGHGFRTAFIHPGGLVYDHQEQFLRSHGFNYIAGEKHDYPQPRDWDLLPAVIKWIKSDPVRPFFLTIWTQDTHHPYLSNSHRNYDTRDGPHNRYLNAIHSSDALIGRLNDALDDMKLADDTLLVVTGDHGEAFGEHGRLSHGFTIYDEEVHVPLMLINPKLAPTGMMIHRMGRQIDIAPTILQILGHEPPGQWQGTSLLAANHPDRAYLFSSWAAFTLGVVDGDFKYICDFDNDRQELYDVAADPHEQHDLSSDASYSAMLEREHLRLEAWLSFQNRFLERFVSESPGP